MVYSSELRSGATRAPFALRRWQINYSALSSPRLVQAEALLSHWRASHWEWRKWAGCSLTLFIWICIVAIVKSRAGVIVKCCAVNRERIGSSSKHPSVSKVIGTRIWVTDQMIIKSLSHYLISEGILGIYSRCVYRTWVLKTECQTDIVVSLCLRFSASRSFIRA